MPGGKIYKVKRKKPFKISKNLETTIKTIAKREDAKNTQYQIHEKLVLATPASAWATEYGRPAVSAMVELLQNSLFALIISDASALTYNENVQSDTRSRCYGKVFQANLAFENYSQFDQIVRVSLIAVPNTSSVTTAEPSPQDQPYTNLRGKGIFKRGLNSYASTSARFDPASRVIATKRFKLPHSRGLYDVNGSSVQDDHFYPLKEITLTKSYKTKGQRLDFNSTTQNRGADNENIYLCVSTNFSGTSSEVGVRMWGVAGMKFTVDQPTQNTNNT